MPIISTKICKNVCSIFINRPEKRNALNIAAIRKLREALNAFEQDDSLQVAILGGVGGNFCSGYDLNEFIHSKSQMPNINNIQQMLWPIERRLTKNKITIAAIEGHAVGFGLELALKCDFRIGDRDSRMGFLNRRFAIPIMNGGTVILPKLVGLSVALELISTGRAQLALESYQRGLLYHMSDVGCAIGKSLNLARSLLKFDQISLMHDMNATFNNITQSEIELMKLERAKSIEYLQQCGPLEAASKFLKGELLRHGSSDMGNMLEPDPEVTL